MNPGEEPSRDGLLRRLQAWTLIATPTLYVTGLLVSLVHVLPYGVTSFDLVRAQYFLAGLWTWLPPVISLVTLTFLFQFTEIVRVGRRGDLRGAVTHSLATAQLGLSVIVVVACGSLLRTWSTFISWKDHNAATFAWTLVGFIVVIGLALVTRRVAPRDPVKRFGTVASVGAIACAAVFYAMGFAVTVYRAIPMSLGGGRPIWARFILSDLPPTVLSDYVVSNERYVVLQITSRGYIVGLKEPQLRVVELPFSTISAVVIEGHAATAAEQAQVRALREHAIIEDIGRKQAP